MSGLWAITKTIDVTFEACKVRGCFAQVCRMDRQHQKTGEGVGVDEVEISIVIHQVGGSATQGRMVGSNAVDSLNVRGWILGCKNGEKIATQPGVGNKIRL